MGVTLKKHDGDNIVALVVVSTTNQWNGARYRIGYTTDTRECFVIIREGEEGETGYLPLSIPELIESTVNKLSTFVMNKKDIEVTINKIEAFYQQTKIEQAKFLSELDVGYESQSESKDVMFDSQDNAKYGEYFVIEKHSKTNELVLQMHNVVAAKIAMSFYKERKCNNFIAEHINQLDAVLQCVDKQLCVDISREQLTKRISNVLAEFYSVNNPLDFLQYRLPVDKLYAVLIGKQAMYIEKEDTFYLFGVTKDYLLTQRGV